MEESASIDCKSIKEWLIEIKENVEPNFASKCSIYRVPEDIRRINVDAYTPKVISIGPLHHGKAKLAAMENKKRMYVKNFLSRIHAEKEEEIIAFVQNNEKRIRASYADTIELGSYEFVKIIISDALFIIELFLSIFYGLIVDHSWLHIPVLRSAISLDLQLLENQLPYFILKEIYNLVVSEEDATFLQISLLFFRNAFDLDIYDLPEEPEHFTDLIRTALVKSHKSHPKWRSTGPIRDLPCAQELRKSGIRFRSSSLEEGLLDLRLRLRKNTPFRCFREIELWIPRLTVYDGTECLLKNIIALEQCLYPSDTVVCNYVRLMNYLMKTNKDVELLVEAGIVSNVYVEDAEIANLFNNLGSQIIVDENSSYHGICEKLKKIHRWRWNRTRTTLWRVITDPVGAIATTIAFLALLLTLIQTVCSLKQMKWL